MIINRKKFFDGYRNTLDTNRKLDQKEVNAIDLFLNMVDPEIDRFSLKQWAYIFATVFHETQATFEPVKEAFKLSEEWRRTHLRYFPYYGRGYVQITWKANYEKFSKRMNIDFVHNPDLAMIPKYSFKILLDGFEFGLFTGTKLSKFVNENKTDYVGARACINGEDRAELIEGYAKLFEKLFN